LGYRGAGQDLDPPPPKQLDQTRLGRSFPPPFLPRCLTRQPLSWGGGQIRLVGDSRRGGRGGDRHPNPLPLCHHLKRGDNRAQAGISTAAGRPRISAQNHAIYIQRCNLSHNLYTALGFGGIQTGTEGGAGQVPPIPAQGPNCAHVLIIVANPPPAEGIRPTPPFHSGSTQSPSIPT